MIKPYSNSTDFLASSCTGSRSAMTELLQSGVPTSYLTFESMMSLRIVSANMQSTILIAVLHANYFRARCYEANNI